MPEQKSPQEAAPGKNASTPPRARAVAAPEPQPALVINARASRKTTKMASGRPEAADKLTLAPPKGQAEPTDLVVVKNSTAPRKRNVTVSTATRNGSSRAGSGQAPGGSRRPTGPVINGQPSRRSSSAQSGGKYHETDRLPDISDKARHEITGIVLIVIGLILLFGMLAQQGLVAQLGLFGKKLFGVGAFIIPPLIIVMGATFIWEGLTNRERFNQTRITGLIFMVIAFVSVVHLIAGNPKSLAEEGGGGGFFAYYVNELLGSLITHFGVFVLWLALFLIGLMLLLSMSLKDMGVYLRNAYRWTRGEPPLVAGEPLQGSDYEDFDDLDEYDEMADFGAKKRSGRPLPDDDDLLDELLLNGGRAGRPKRATLAPEEEPQFTHTISLTGDDETTVIAPASPLLKPEPNANQNPLRVPPEPPAKPQRPLQQNWKRDDSTLNPPAVPNREWQIPSVNILASFSDVEINPQELRKKARLIETTLASFGVDAVVREVNTGPTVTQFALEPGTGVKVSRITALANDLALALAAPAIRLEAPVPGQSRVGIEVPNAKIATVGLREIMEADEFVKRGGRLKFALGRDVSGQPIVADLAKMPHLLIAGSTGSGKSVCLNSIVAAYLLQYRPADLQFIMIDPKMVELSTYNGIPHLRFPVVTQIESDPEKERNRNDRTPTVMSVLKWSIREMEKRYKLLSVHGHRNIESFNKAAGTGNDLEKMPYLVLIVDELADLMMVAPEEAESAICRLAQKARAVGIHLILATQRPSVDVVTGLIKANFPSRITFAVTSQIDSRVILDMGGAEKLLGRGDMLYMASDAAKPMRVQGVYVGDDEIDMLVKHWRQQNDFLTGDKKDFVQPQLWPQELQDIEAENDTTEADELFEEALEIVRETRSASTSLLQRRLRIGYNRAARLIEDLAQAGVIGQAEGSRPRPVLIAEEDLNEPLSLTAAASVFEPQAESAGVIPGGPAGSGPTVAPARPPEPLPRSPRPAPTAEYDPDPPL